MKNPIPHLKHMWKDPITTIEEADARKKEVMPWLYGSIGVAVVPGILAGIVDVLSFLTIFSIVGVFGIMAFGFMLFIISKAKKKFRALTCNKCNTMATISTKEEYAKYVTYVLGGDEAKYGGVSHPASNNGVVSKITASGSASAVALISLTCPHCGNVKKLKYSITPFKCSATQSNVHVRDVELVKMKLENAVRQAVNDYNEPEKRSKMPYTIHSSKHPNYANRDKLQVGATVDYNGATIVYRKDADEMVEQFFLANQLDGNIVEVEEK